MLIYVTISKPFISKLRNLSWCINEGGLLILYGCCFGWLKASPSLGYAKFEFWTLIFIIITFIILILNLLLIFFDSSMHINKIKSLLRQRESAKSDPGDPIFDSGSDISSESSVTQKEITIDEKDQSGGDKYQFDTDEFDREIYNVDNDKKA